MSTRLALTSIISTLVLTQATAIAGISDFYISSTSGKLFHVDSQSLQAKEVADLDGFFNASTDIEYMGGGQLFATNGNTVYRYNTSTGIQTTEINRNHFGGFWVGGLSKTTSGLLHVQNSVIVVGEGIVRVGIEYDINDGSYQPYGNFGLPENNDYEILDSTRILTVRKGVLTIFNTDTGVVESEFTVWSPDGGFAPNSILSIDGGLMLMSPYGELHTLDLESQTSTYYGQIGGTGTAYLFGATIPAPSSLAILGTTLILSTRRRRG